MPNRDKVILVVDDESLVRDIISRNISSSTDYSVLEAEDGFIALDKLKNNKIDLLITDIKMPRMTGIELLGEIRRIGLDTPVIIITGFGTLNDAIVALRLGALNFIMKPFRTNELLSVIDKVLTASEEKVSLSGIIPFIKSQTTSVILPNDHTMFQGVISYVNELVKTCWQEYISGAVDIKVCLYEALLNAYEHGNLEVNSNEKEQMLERDPNHYENFLINRMKIEPYASRKIHLNVDINAERAIFSVEDEGYGFNVSGLPDPTAIDNLIKNLGRGILLIKSIMSEVVYNEKGNKVTMTMIRR